MGLGSAIAYKSEEKQSKHKPAQEAAYSVQAIPPCEKGTC